MNNGPIYYSVRLGFLLKNQGVGVNLSYFITFTES